MTRDGFINSLSQLRTKQWYRGVPLQLMNERGRRLYWRAGDLAARLCLNGEAMREFDAGNKQGSCMLTHAERYLADRLAYELAPWPKGFFKVEAKNEMPLGTG